MKTPLKTVQANTEHPESSLTSVLCIAVALFAWSSGNVVSRIAVRRFSSGELTMFRLLSSCILMDLIAAMRHISLPRKKDFPLFILLGACGYALYTGLINLGIRTESASSLSLLLATLPFFTAVTARIILKEPFPLWRVCLAVLSLCGVAVIAFHDGGSIRSGAVWILLSVLFQSLYQVILRKLSGQYTSFQISVYSLNTGTILMLWNLPSLLRKLNGIEPIYVFCGLWLGLMTTAIAYFCWGYAMQRAKSAAGLNMWVFMTPPLTAVFSWIFLGELLGASEWIGGSMILAGLVLNQLLPRLFPNVFHLSGQI